MHSPAYGCCPGLSIHITEEITMSRNSFDLITFGEIMLRLSPPRHARIVDGDIFEKRAGGAELNVASGVALMGLRTGIISNQLPRQFMERRRG